MDFDAPGDLGFFDLKDEEPEEPTLDNGLFEQPIPGEEDEYEQ